jgi:hypothetical protein
MKAGSTDGRRLRVKRSSRGRYESILKSMKRQLFDFGRVIGIAVAVGAAAVLGGCAGGTGRGTASLQESSSVQGRDLGRGGATSGGLSSMDRSGNAADMSVYDARQMQQ